MPSPITYRGDDGTRGIQGQPYSNNKPANPNNPNKQNPLNPNVVNLFKYYLSPHLLLIQKFDDKTLEVQEEMSKIDREAQAQQASYNGLMAFFNNAKAGVDMVFGVLGKLAKNNRGQ